MTACSRLGVVPPGQPATRAWTWLQAAGKSAPSHAGCRASPQSHLDCIPSRTLTVALPAPLIARSPAERGCLDAVARQRSAPLPCLRPCSLLRGAWRACNPQVLYANLCFKAGVWDFPDLVSLNSSQRFFLNFNVTFIPLPQQPVNIKKPAPPLVTPLPADIFYPFVTSTAGSGARFASGMGLTVAAVALLMATRILY